MIWEVDILPAEGEADRPAERLIAAAAHLPGAEKLTAATGRGFLLQGEGLDRDAVEVIAKRVLVDSVVESFGVRSHDEDPEEVNGRQVLHVLPKPGVMDPVAQTAEQTIADLGYARPIIRTFRKYWLAGVDEQVAQQLADQFLANDAIEQVVAGPLQLERLDAGSGYTFELKTISLAGLDDEGLMRLSKQGQLYLQLAEMQTLQKFFAELGREPTDIELETLAQTWSEHCSHKTLAGRIAYRDERGERRFDNMLKETIFAATNALRQRWQADPTKDDWCVSVFVDNAGVVKFDETDNLCFKVETHNHPSALEPYGGANTGLGGVIRDTLGTGLGAKPIASTDVFCFAPPTVSTGTGSTGTGTHDALPPDALPPGVLHPRRVMQGVVEGVRDYGNRMGIPTVNGAICFDERYLGNPLVFCGNAGLIPHDKSFGEPRPGDLIVAVGGRTGRDGIHGATFSSAELTHESESLSGGAVQIGNAIEEKRVMDVLLQARDQNLYTAVTDCGAGGFSSAVGEMGEEIGATVQLENAPLKYDGLSYTEIWISEAQERMVFSVPEANWQAMHDLCAAEGVEATVLGTFTPTGRLTLTYNGQTVGDLPMSFMHDGRPPVVREASYSPPATQPMTVPERGDYTDNLLAILGSLNVASKEWVIRQYDHEVQAGSVVKPLVGVESDGPSDAAVVRPKLGSDRGMVLSCGINPRYGDLDPYHMAASAIDEAMRNAVAVGADPSRIALLDNFCWGDCEKPETLGSLVRAAMACHDLSLVLETPFVSGKDSLNNEFSYVNDNNEKQTIAIPSTLLISAVGQIADVHKAVTMDFKAAGNSIYLVGVTKDELGGSHFALVNELTGGQVPTVDAEAAKTAFAAVHASIDAGLVASCHDLSEGGLAVALAEMAFAGGLGAEVDIDAVPTDDRLGIAERLFSESNTRFLCEVSEANREAFERTLAGVPHSRIGAVTQGPTCGVWKQGEAVVLADIAALKEAWQAPLRW